MRMVDIHEIKQFNRNYAANVLMNSVSSSNTLAVNEHLMIHRLKVKCIKPFGLNSYDPFDFGILLLNLNICK